MKKKIFFTLSFLVLVIAAIAQPGKKTLVTDKLIINDSFLLDGVWYSSLSDFSTGGGNGTAARTDTMYSLGNGAWVRASGPGVTFTRSTSTEGVFAIPAGIELYSGFIHHTSAQNPGSTYFMRFVFSGTRNTNNTILDIDPPDVIVLSKIVSESNSNTVSRISPINYNSTSGTINLVKRITSVSPLEIKLENFSDSQVGSSGGTIIKFIF